MEGTAAWGHTIATLLHAQRYPFVAFDTRPERVGFGSRDPGQNVLYGDIADPESCWRLHKPSGPRWWL